MNIREIFDTFKYDPTISKKSKTWFLTQANEIAKNRINRQNLMKRGSTVTRIIPGSMYMFFYDPKYKETLPYYDRFPLVFPFTALEDGFIGLNMHYLPYQMRILLFEALLKFKTTKGINENTRLRYSWSAVQSLARHQLAEPCVKRYLKDHIQSELRLITPTDWTTALMLPVESFVGSAKNQIWQNSINRGR